MALQEKFFIFVLISGTAVMLINLYTVNTYGETEIIDIFKKSQNKSIRSIEEGDKGQHWQNNDTNLLHDDERVPTVAYVNESALLAYLTKDNQSENAGEPLPTMAPNITIPRIPLPVTQYHKHDFLKDKPFTFDKRFKNPCWYEGRELKCLPYFFVVGMRKSGTSSLFNAIMKHPDAKRWGGKEAHFFGYGQTRHEAGSDDIYTYVNIFENASRIIQGLAARADKVGLMSSKIDAIFGDGSICTIFINYDWRYFPGNEHLSEPKIVSLDYVHHFLPDAKIIIVFRDPAERLYSEYYFNHGNIRQESNLSAETFHEEVMRMVEAYGRCFEKRTVRACVYEREFLKMSHVNVHLGIYYIYMQELYRLFNKDQVLVLRMSDLDSIDTYKTVFSFLNMAIYSDADIEDMLPESHVNPRLKEYKMQGPMLNYTRDILTRFYRPFNERMASLMNDSYFLFE